MRNLGVATAIGITALLVGGALVAVLAVAVVAPVVVLLLPARVPDTFYRGLTRAARPGA